MNETKEKEELFKIITGLDKVDIYNEFKKIEESIETSNELYKYFDDIKSLLINKNAYFSMIVHSLINKIEN